MKRAFLLAIAAVLAVGVAAAADNPGDAIVGLWKTEPDVHGYAIVQITRQGKRYNGRIVWLEKPLYGPDEERPGKPKVDLNNSDPKLRERPILGLELVKSFVYNGKGKWKKGTIYDPNKGKTYKCKAWLADADTLKLRGYIGFSLLGRNATWKRVAALPEASAAAPEPSPAPAPAPAGS